MGKVAVLQSGGITREVAESEFERWADRMDIDLDLARLDEDSRKSFEENKYKITRAMLQGKLVIDDQGRAVFTPSEGDPIVFAEPRGRSLAASDARKDGQNMKKLFAIMADFTGQPEARFMSMLQRDLRVCQSLTTLFLA